LSSGGTHAIKVNEVATKGNTKAKFGNAAASAAMAASAMIANAAMLTGFYLMQKESEGLRRLGQVFMFLAGAIMAASIAMQFMKLGLTPGGVAAAAVAGGIIMAGVGTAMTKATQPPKFDETTYDMGGRIYDTGGALGSRHFPVMVEPGESIIPKTQNMLGGTGSGIT
jgi:hypothetical protein